MIVGTLDLPDLNVWLALADQDHAHHSRARRYWEDESAPRIAFCRITMLGLLRLLTNRKVMRGAPWSPGEAWQAWRAFAALPEITFLQESDAAEAAFEAWTSQPRFAPHRWTDAWLAALACTTGARVVSFNSDFTTFRPLTFLHLIP